MIARPGYRTGLGFIARIAQHRAGQHILGFRMGRHTKARHIYANHAHAIDLLRQQIERHAGSRGHAKISDDDRVIIFWLRQIMDRIANIFEKLAGDECFRIEGHIAHRTARTIEMAGEGKAIDAAGTAGKDRRNAAHA